MSMTGRTAISIRGLTKRFANGVMALGPIDLDVGEGEFVALVGPSGCGKSTLLRVIAGLISPTDGKVDVDRAGGSVRDRRAGESGRATFGFVFQEPTLMPWATVLANVILPLKLAGVAREEARHRALTELDRIGLADFANAYPRELSGGMKMRASIARALVTDPAILLMDEPFAALDEITRFRLNDDLLELARSLRKTVVFVTHSVFESVYLAGRVLILTARPARVVENVEIAAPPVRRDGFRASPDYVRQCGMVTRALQDAQADASGAAS
jgi:NitT/TauT family transport system ATP-binding protein